MNKTQTWTIDELSLALDQYEQELRDKGLRRNTINTYVQHPERFIRWLAERYSPTGPRSESQIPKSKPSSKYEPLYAYLINLPNEYIRMTFVQIEQVLGFRLPASARRYPAWWANEYEGTHSHARSWLDASYETKEVDLNSQSVTFVIR